MKHKAWVIAAVALGLFAVLAVAVYLSGKPYFGFDLAVTRAVQSSTGPWMDRLLGAVSWTGDAVLQATVLVVLALVVLLALGARREAAVLLGVVLVGQILKIGLKLLVARPRPDPNLVRVHIEAMEVYSFPSGHTVHYVVFFGFLWYVTFALVKSPYLRWPLLVVLGGLVLLVGLARVYLGAHWISDVVGGYLLGAAVLAAGIGLYQRR